jgi:hypothetical protein
MAGKATPSPALLHNEFGRVTQAANCLIGAPGTAHPTELAFSRSSGKHMLGNGVCLSVIAEEMPMGLMTPTKPNDLAR